MENQQSINTVLSFAAKSVQPEILEQLLIGRGKAADFAWQAIEGIVENKSNQQLLLIGQRGMGKTHLLRILYHRSQAFLKEGKLMIAYFSEEEYGVSNYFDFLIRILYAFQRWNDADLAYLNGKIEELQTLHHNAQTRFAEQIIADYIGDKPLLILAENFVDILESIGPREQGRLRNWLYSGNNISIIATSQSLSDDFDREDRPFYGFFTPYYLKTLSYSESLSFLISLAELEQRQDVIDHLKHKGKAQVKAIHRLVKGNHRLLVTFYEFLKSDTLAKLSNHFIKTINDLKPYYETYIRYLPAQQQKILRYVALSKTPQLGTVISKNCFIDQKSLSKQLSELTRKRLVEGLTDPTDKRNKLYEINEPLLRISIEVGEHREGISALFIDFLAIYYDYDELSLRKESFSKLLMNSTNHDVKSEVVYELQALERALNLKKSDLLKTEEINSVTSKLHQAFEANNKTECLRIIEENKSLIGIEAYSVAMLYIHVLENDFVRALERFGQFSNSFVRDKALCSVGTGLYYISYLDGEDIDALKKSVDFARKAIKYNESKNEALYYLGRGLSMLAVETLDQKYEIEARQILDKLLINNPDNSYYQLETGYFKNFMATAGIYGDEIQLKHFDESLKHFILSRDLQPDNLRLYKIWGIALSFYVSRYPEIESPMSVYIDSLNQLSIDSRRVVWDSLVEISYIDFFKSLLPLQLRDLNTMYSPGDFYLVKWYMTFLTKGVKGLTSENILFLAETADQIVDRHPELAISKRYLETLYRMRYGNDPSALVELPKEQREFFEDHILSAFKEDMTTAN